MEQIEQIDQKIEELIAQKKQLEEQALNDTLLAMFTSMTKEQIVEQVRGMIEQSPMIKMEVKRLLIDEPANYPQDITA